MNNVHYLAAAYPRLRWSADAVSEVEETGTWLSCLEYLFSDEELNLSGGKPVDGSLPARLATAAFWADAGTNIDGSAPVHYTAGQRHYIETWSAMDGFAAFEEYMRVWARVFYTVRMDPDTARDVLLLFLQQNLDCLKNLFILGRDGNRTIAPDMRAVQECLNAPANQAMVMQQQFSSWVLDHWLPLNLKQYHCRAEGSAASNAVDTATVEAV